MRRHGLIAIWFAALPAATADAPPESPDPEFLEFLAEVTEEDEAFIAFLESEGGERALKRAEKAAAKEEDDE